MRHAMLGALIGIGIVIAAVAAAEPRGENFAPHGGPAGACGGGRQ